MNQAKKIMNKIRSIEKRSALSVSFQVEDNSVQSELRLQARWNISIPVDDINIPCSVAGVDFKYDHLWGDCSLINSKIRQVACIRHVHYPEHKFVVKKINAKTKSGPERRAMAKAEFIVEAGNVFLAEYRKASARRSVSARRKKIAALQEKQKELLKEIREVNSAAYLQNKTNRRERIEKNINAFKTGRFWEADEKALKAFFCPPFDKNRLADVSEKWRACLFLECNGLAYGSRWKPKFKMVGTGFGFLCGIDDNGEQWGHRVNLLLDLDRWDNYSLKCTVEEAMSELFGIPYKALVKDACWRQGDLLFHSEPIPEETVMKKQDCWDVRETHRICSAGMERNGSFFRSANEITVEHTSHATVVLPPGEYRIYMLGFGD